MIEESELESLRQHRTEDTVKYTDWEYGHWFEHEPEDYESNFLLTHDEREALFEVSPDNV